MYKEAAIVLENTLVAGGTIREPLLYVSCLVRQNQPQKARRAALDAMARLSPAETARLAEFAAALSLAAPAPAAADAKPEGGEAWAAQNRAAQAALRAWLQGEPEDAVDRLLGGIPLRSPFGAMRLILKSLITPHDAAKARALLAMVPAGSIFAGVRDAAEAARADDQDLLGQWARLRPAQQQFAAEMRGLPRDRLGLLNQILDAERRGPGALLSLLTRRGLPLPEDELRAACLNLLPAAPGPHGAVHAALRSAFGNRVQSGCGARGGGEAGMVCRHASLGRYRDTAGASSDGGVPPGASGGAASPGRSGALAPRHRRRPG